MSNSPLVNCTVKSPNHSGKRTHSIDTLTPHCVVGQLSAESIGGCFDTYDPKNGASCNYGIGKDGRVVLVVDECNRSWCSSSNSNDQRAVTIECASDTTEPYAFKDVVYQKLIALCVDICKRNGKKKLLWLGDKNKTLNYSPKSDEMVLTVHRWFANKSCPGNWMFARMGDLASKVTAQLGGSTVQPSTPSAPASGLSVGTVVNFAGGKHYTSANAASGSAAKAGPAKITAVSANAKHPYHVIHTNGTSNVYGWVDASAVSVAGGSAAVNYMVRVKITDLNIRSGPGTNNAKKGVIKPGVYTIVQEATGTGASKWGKLKSGAGWISLDHCEKM